MPDPNRFIGLVVEGELHETITDLQSDLVDESTRTPLAPHSTIVPPHMMAHFRMQTIIEEMEATVSDYDPGPFEVTVEDVITLLDGNVAALKLGPSDDFENLRWELLTWLGLEREDYERLEMFPDATRHITVLEGADEEPLSADKMDRVMRVDFPDVVRFGQIALFEKTGDPNKRYDVIHTDELRSY